MRRLTVLFAVLTAMALGLPAASAQEPPPWFVDPATLPFDALPGTDTQRYWGLDENPGAADDGWRIEVPANWNGGLVLWAHGYRGVGPQLIVDNPSLRPLFLGQGWAWAASSYRANGYAVEEGVEDTNELLAIFAEQTGLDPQRVVFHGASLGGHVTGAAIERYPGNYDAALPYCGVMGDVELYDYFQDVNLVAQELAGLEAQIPPPPDYIPRVVPQIRAALGYPEDLTGPGHQFAAILEQLSGGERPGDEAALAAWSGGDVPFLFGLYGGALSGGQVDPALEAASTNLGTVYQYDDDPALSPEERELNAGVLRDGPAAPPPFPIITGDLSMPVLSLHTLGDLFVPFSMEQIYAREVAANGDSDLLVQRAIRDTGHCGFQAAELVTAWNDLIRWLDTGERPAGDDVLDPEVVADRDYGCRFTVSAAVPSRAGYSPCGAPPAVARTAGADATGTAVALSAATREDAESVVLASDAAPSYALAAEPLAGRRDAPLLLTPRDGLREDVAAEIARLGATRAYLIGNTAQLSRQVEDDLTAAGVEVVRLDGASRYRTAAAIARELGPSAHAYVVRGAGLDHREGVDADALTVAGLAAFTGDPVLFSERLLVPPATFQALREQGVQRVTVVGGYDAVSPLVVAQLRLAGLQVERLGGRGGADDTSAAVAERSVASGASPNQPWVAAFDDWAGALAGGAAAAETGDVLVLVDGADPARSDDSLEWLTDNRRLLTDVRLAGAGITADAEAALTEAVAAP